MTLLRARKIMSDIDAFEAELRAKEGTSVRFHTGPLRSWKKYRDADVIVSTHYEVRKKCVPAQKAVKSARAAK